jgi:hypothetical protein
LAGVVHALTITGNFGTGGTPPEGTFGTEGTGIVGTAGVLVIVAIGFTKF